LNKWKSFGKLDLKKMNIVITMDRLKMGKHMVLGDGLVIIWILIFMKDNFKTERKMVMVDIFIIMEQTILDYLKMVIFI
jgi:ABC-type iron transport system FetAB permease component